MIFAIKYSNNHPMRLVFKNEEGKVIKIKRGIKTRSKFKELYGDPFQMDKQNKASRKYIVMQIVAEPSPNTSLIWGMAAFIIMLLFFKDAKSYTISVLFPLYTALFMYSIKSIIVFLDKKAVRKFNNS